MEKDSNTAETEPSAGQRTTVQEATVGVCQEQGPNSERLRPDQDAVRECWCLKVGF